MTVPTFAERQKQWSSPPVDDIGYIPASEMLAMDDQQFAALMTSCWHNRYEGWRNHRGNWVDMFDLDTMEGQRILDYGCGVGMDAVQYANQGNKVWLADIAAANLMVAERLFRLYGLKEERSLLIKARPPFLAAKIPKLDVIHCVGVLHHIPDPVPVVEAMHGWLADGGRLNLMLYSDVAWRMATGKHVLPQGPVEESPYFERFWRRWDAVGGYADWYDENRIFNRFGEWFVIERSGYLTPHREYLGAVLRKR